MMMMMMMMMMMIVKMMNQWTWGVPHFQTNLNQGFNFQPMNGNPQKLCLLLLVTRNMVNNFAGSSHRRMQPALAASRLIHETQN